MICHPEPRKTAKDLTVAVSAIEKQVRVIRRARPL
jgi:hypothetical protein